MPRVLSILTGQEIEREEVAPPAQPVQVDAPLQLLDALRAEFARLHGVAQADQAEISRLTDKLNAPPPPAPRSTNAQPPEYAMRIDRGLNNRIAGVLLQPADPNTGFPSYTMHVERDSKGRVRGARLRPVESK